MPILLLICFNIMTLMPQDASANQGEKVDHYLGKLRESEAASIEKQGAFIAEVEGLKRLVDLYKRYFEDATAKISGLEQHEQVMQETHANVLKGLRDKIALQVGEAEAGAAKERATWEQKVAALEQQLKEAQEKCAAAAANSNNSNVVALVENTFSSSSSSSSGGAASASGVAADSVLAIENFDGVGITALYDRIVRTEKELYAERSKRREVELYMQQILKDVESKAPIIAAQRRDYHRVVESHTALTRRLDLLVVENVDLKQALKSVRHTAQSAVEEAHVLEEHNADLSRQVQHLLKRSLGVEQQQQGGQQQMMLIEDDEQAPSGGVVSQYLVTFEDVTQLQQRNAELLRVVRKLSRQQEQEQQQALQITEGGDATATGTATSSSSAANTTGSQQQQQHLQAALEELQSMREARLRTEEMVLVLAQQRDMYRAMAEGDSSVFPTAATTSVTSPSFARAPMATTPAAHASSSSSSSPTAAGEALTTPSASSAANAAAAAAAAADRDSAAVWQGAAVRELQSKLTQAEEERRRLQDRLTRCEEVEQLLNEALDKVRREATTARLEGAQGTSEARFQKERAER